MNNRFVLMAAAAVWAAANGPAAAQVATNFAVDIVSGPLVGERYVGATAADSPAATPAITFEFGGIEFTEVDDVQDPDANSPRVNFQGEEFLGNTFIVSRFGNNPTEMPLIQGVAIDGFAIDNDDFGYLVGADLYRGTVSYGLSAESVALDIAPNIAPDVELNIVPDAAQSVPEPSVGWGLATVLMAIFARGGPPWRPSSSPHRRKTKWRG